MLIGNKYYINKEIGKGTFGIIYNGHNKITNDMVAIKVERERKDNLLTLKHESRILHTLKGLKGVINLRWYGYQAPNYYMVMNLLGITLEKYKNLHEHYMNKKLIGLSKKKIVSIGTQMLTIIELVHKRNIIHRDIKSENFLFGYDNDPKLYLIDFGLAKRYKTSNDEHIAYRTDKSLIGTVRYVSINAHDCKELSRRDDIESIGYLILYLIIHKLPWQGLKIHDGKMRLDMIRQKKQNIILCDIPEPMKKYFNYIWNVNFKEEPNYEYLKTLVSELDIKQKIISEDT